MSNSVEAESKAFSEVVSAMADIDIPDFQRSLVWSVEQKRNLLLSTVLRLPIGALSIGVDTLEGGAKRYLLDGQQRLDCIKKMLEPSTAVSWLEIKRPTWPNPPAGDQAWRSFYSTEIMCLIYEYLGIHFSKSENKITMEGSEPYTALKNEWNAGDAAVKLTKRKEINKLKYDTRKAWVD
jgi:hypothetical protein